MDFMQKRKEQLKISSMGDLIKSGKLSIQKDPKTFVLGPEEFDCLEDKWAKKEVLGIIGGSGSGKTSVVFEIFRRMLENSKDPNSIVIFVSLEMTTDKIAKRWLKLVGHDSELSDRLYIISNYDDDGKARLLTATDILSHCKMIKNALKVNVLSVCVDHLHIITLESGETYNKVCQRIKDIAVELDSFAILLSQTTKGKGGSLSDKPLDKDASYDCSQFAWIASYVITIHQPLAAVVEDSELYCLAWAYMKIREKSKEDKVTMGRFNLLHFDLDTGRLRKLTPDELFIFNTYYPQVKAMREAEEDRFDAIYNTEYKVKENYLKELEE